MKRSAFTLLEVLLVTAITAVLAAIIFAGFGPAREAARQQSCASNLHQIGTAISLYIADYGGIDPVVGVRMKPSELGLPIRLDPLWQGYVKNRALLFCPSYHGTERLSAMGSTYWWPLNISEESAPELDIPGIVARRGQDYVLVGCDQHNGSLDFPEQPRWATKRILALRISQQVQVKQVPARELSAHDW